MNMAPDDLQFLRSVDFIHFDQKDAEFFQVGLQKLFRKAAAPRPATELYARRRRIAPAAIAEKPGPRDCERRWWGGGGGPGGEDER